MFLKECADFFLERHFPVMDFLIDDIGNDGSFVRFADRKGTVTGLPTEIAVTFFPHHFRGGVPGVKTPGLVLLPFGVENRR